jgi:hypothetical protein
MTMPADDRLRLLDELARLVAEAPADELPPLPSPMLRSSGSTCETRQDADAVLERALGESRQRTTPSVDPRITLAEYAEHHWLPIVRAAAKPRTVETYQGGLDRHLRPGLGAVRLSRLQRAHVKRFVTRKLQEDGLSPAYVELIVAVLARIMRERT